MDQSIIMLIALCAVIVIGLLHCFFGYKLARFLLPLCGVALLEGVLYTFVYGELTLDPVGIWLFFAGSALTFYMALFFFPRLAAFFIGMAGGALALIFAVYALSLHEMPIIYPVGLTLCLLCGLLAAVYKRVGVALFTAVFGGCVAALLAVFLFYGGDAAGYLLMGSLLAPLDLFLKSYVMLIGGGALVLAVLGLLLQLKVTANTQLLDSRGGSHAMEF